MATKSDMAFLNTGKCSWHLLVRAFRTEGLWAQQENWENTGGIVKANAPVGLRPKAPMFQEGANATGWRTAELSAG